MSTCSKETWRVLLLEHNDLIRHTLSAALQPLLSPQGLLALRDPAIALDLRPEALDLIIFDVWVGTELQLDLPARLRALAPTAKLLLITDHANPADLFDLCSQVQGCLRKADLTPTKLVHVVEGLLRFGLIISDAAIEAAIRPYRRMWLRSPTPTPLLSERERAIVRLLGAGLTVKEVARHLNISPRTLERHLERLKLKTNTRSILELCLLAERQGLLAVDQGS